MEAATEAEADPQTPRTPTTEDMEYDLAGTPRQTSDYQGSPALPPLHEGLGQDQSRRDPFTSQVQVSVVSSLTSFQVKERVLTAPLAWVMVCQMATMFSPSVLAVAPLLFFLKPDPLLCSLA